MEKLRQGIIGLSDESLNDLLLVALLLRRPDDKRPDDLRKDRLTKLVKLPNDPDDLWTICCCCCWPRGCSSIVFVVIANSSIGILMISFLSLFRDQTAFYLFWFSEINLIANPQEYIGMCDIFWNSQKFWSIFIVITCTPNSLYPCDFIRFVYLFIVSS